MLIYITLIAWYVHLIRASYSKLLKIIFGTQMPLELIIQKFCMKWTRLFIHILKRSLIWDRGFLKCDSPLICIHNSCEKFFHQLGRIRCMWHVACMGEVICAYKILITKPKSRRLWMPRHTLNKHMHTHAHAHTPLCV
jgi:hypothetical protein